MTLDRRDRPTKPRKNSNIQGKGNVQIIENIGSWHHQISRDERKKKRVPKENKKATQNQTI